jgi:hypothetical protein
MATATPEKTSSRQALLNAVRDTIQQKLELDSKSCEVTWDGRPHPSAGNLFVAVHRGPRSNGSRTYLDYVMSFFVTITKRVNEPFDRLGKSNLVAVTRSLEDVADPIIELIHEDVTGQVSQKFAEYLQIEGEYLNQAPMYQGDDGGVIKGAEWFLADPGPGQQIIGVAMQIRFGEATHTRRIGE